MNRTKPAVGVVVGRFQVPDLHNGHRSLLNALAAYKKRLVLVGNSEAAAGRANPLDYSTRLSMLQRNYPGYIFLPINDHPSDEVWSKQLDATVRAIFPHDRAVLLAGRRSFAPHYHGKLPIVTVPTVPFISGELIREAVGSKALDTLDFRKGAIYAAHNQYPRVHMCVDIACMRDKLVLMGKKHAQGSLQFPGGFVDPTDGNLEMAARRELVEECDVSMEGDLKYLGSYFIDDWRYRRGPDKMITVLFAGEYTFGALKPKDDLGWLDWYPLDRQITADVAEGHRQLFRAVINYERHRPWTKT